MKKFRNSGGSFGKSLRIKGLERGVNHNAHKRAIVIHPMNGHPWSYGCFTLPKNKVSKFVDMVKGGVFMYPATEKSPNGKLRLLYECNPLSLIVEQAGGQSTDGHGRILEIEAQKLHQRTPIYMGSQCAISILNTIISK